MLSCRYQTAWLGYWCAARCDASRNQHVGWYSAVTPEFITRLGEFLTVVSLVTFPNRFTLVHLSSSFQKQQQQQQTDLRRRFLPHQNDLFIFVGVVFSSSSSAVSTNSETSQTFCRASMPFTDHAVIIEFLSCSSVLTVCELNFIHASASHLWTKS